MAYNKGLTQEEKDRINQGIDELVAQGKNLDEIRAWKEAQVAGAQKAAAEGKPSPAAEEAPSAGGDSISDDGSSEYKPQTWDEFAQTAGVKRERVDDEGEVINLAKDFGQLGEIVESIPFIGDLVDDMYGAVKSGFSQGQTVDDALALFAQGTDADPETIQKYIEAVENQRSQPVSKEMEDFNETYEAAGGGTWGFLKAIAQNPSVAATTAVSSLVAMINPASAAGAAIGGGTGAAIGAAAAGVTAIPGAIGGAFAGAGGILETGVSFTEFLEEELGKKGLEFNEEGIAKVLEDEDALARIRGKSATRGGVIAVIDGLTAGVASKAAKGVANTAKTASKLKGVLAATAIEGAGGGVGEASARLAVGQELDAREIGLEIVGEFGTGIAIGKAALASQPKYEINGKKVNRKTLEATLIDNPDTAATMKAQNDPQLQAQINEAVTGDKGINENTDILTSDEAEVRRSKVEEVANTIKERDKHAKDKKSDEYITLNEMVKEARAEVKQLTKEQNSIYKGITKEQRDAIAGNQAQIDSNNKTISTLSKPIKIGGIISTTKKNLINKLQDKNTELAQNTEQIRTELKTQAEVRAKKAEEKAAVKEQEAQAEVTPEEAEAQAQEEQQAAQAAQVQEEMNSEIDEEANDNAQKLDSLTDEMLELGVDIKGIEGTATQNKGVDYTPLSKTEGDAYVAGDFEKDITTDEDIPLEKVDAKKAVKKIQDVAKQLGAQADVEVVRVGDGWGVQGKLTAGKRPESLAVKYAAQQEQAVSEQEAQEQGFEVQPDQEPSQEEVQAGVDQAVAAAKYAGAPVEQTPEGVFIPGGVQSKAKAKEAGIPYETSSAKVTGNLLNSFINRGYPDAEVIQTPEGVVIDKGPFDPNAVTSDEFAFKTKQKVKSEGVLRQQQQAASISGVHKSKKKQIPRKRKHKGDEFSFSDAERYGKEYHDQQYKEITPERRDAAEDVMDELAWSVAHHGNWDGGFFSQVQGDTWFDMDPEVFDQAIEDAQAIALNEPEEYLERLDNVRDEVASEAQYSPDDETLQQRVEFMDNEIADVKSKTQDEFSFAEGNPKAKTSGTMPDGTKISEVEFVYEADGKTPYEIRAAVEKDGQQEELVSFEREGNVWIGGVDDNSGAETLGLDQQGVKEFAETLKPTELAIITEDGPEYFDSKEELDNFRNEKFDQNVRDYVGENPNVEEYTDEAVLDDMRYEMGYDENDFSTDQILDKIRSIANKDEFSFKTPEGQKLYAKQHIKRQKEAKEAEEKRLEELANVDQEAIDEAKKAPHRRYIPTGSAVKKAGGTGKKKEVQVVDTKAIKKELTTPSQSRPTKATQEQIEASRRADRAEGGIIQSPEVKLKTKEEGGQAFEPAFDNSVVSEAKKEKTPELTTKLFEAWKGNKEVAKARLVKALQPFISKVVIGSQRGKSFTPDPDVMGEANKAAIAALNDIDVPNISQLKNKLGTAMRDEIREFYLGAGAPAGTTGRKKDYNTRLNKIRGAIDYLAKTEGELARGKAKVGGKGKTTSKRLEFDNPDRIAEVLREGFPAST